MLPQDRMWKKSEGISVLGEEKQKGAFYWWSRFGKETGKKKANLFHEKQTTIIESIIQ